MLPFQFLFAVALLSPDSLAAEMRKQGATAVAILPAQLDEDPPMESIVRYERADSGVHAVVLDRDADGWKIAGRFNSWWEYTKADGERFLEVRETVAPGVGDLLVRTRSGGTEDSRTTLEIWRLRNGAMVNVLTLLEHEAAMVHPSGDVIVTTTQLEFAPGRLTAIVRKGSAKPTCQLHRWNQQAYRFDASACP